MCVYRGRRQTDELRRDPGARLGLPPDDVSEGLGTHVSSFLFMWVFRTFNWNEIISLHFESTSDIAAICHFD